MRFHLCFLALLGICTATKVVPSLNNEIEPEDTSDVVRVTYNNHPSSLLNNHAITAETTTEEESTVAAQDAKDQAEALRMLRIKQSRQHLAVNMRNVQIENDLPLPTGAGVAASKQQKTVRTPDFTLDKFLADGAFVKYFHLELPLTMGAKSAWAALFNHYRDMELGKLVDFLMDLTVGTTYNDKNQFEDAVKGSTMRFKAFFQPLVDTYEKSSEPAKGGNHFVDRRVDRRVIMESIRSTNVPLFGTKMLHAMGRTLKRMAWTKTPQWSRVIAFHRSIRLFFANWLMPRLQKLSFRGPKYLNFLKKCTTKAMNSRCDAETNGDLAKEEILMDTVVRAACTEMLFGEGVSSAVAKRRSHALRSIGDELLKQRQNVEDFQSEQFHLVLKQYFK